MAKETQETQDQKYLEDLWRQQDEILSVSYTTRQAAKHALRHRWGIDCEFGPYAVEKRDTRLYVIVLDEDGAIRASQKERLTDTTLNKIFGEAKSRPSNKEKPTATVPHKARHAVAAPKTVDMSHSPFAENTEDGNARRKAALEFGESYRLHLREAGRVYALEHFWSSRVNAEKRMVKHEMSPSVYAVVPVRHEGRRRYRIVRRDEIDETPEIKYYTTYHAAWLALRRRGEKLSDPKCKFEIAKFAERCFLIREK